MKDYIKVKDRVKFLTLSLISQNDYYWHGYMIKKFLVKNFEINQEIIYPTLREMLENQDLEAKSILVENTTKYQKKFKITQQGLLELKSFKKQIIDFAELLETISDQKEFEYE